MAEGPSVPAARPPSNVRVLHVAEAFGGGLLEMLRLVTLHAVDAGHEQTIAYGIRPETPEHPEELFHSRVRLERLPWGTRTLRSELAARRALRLLVEECKADVVQLHSSFAGVIGTAALKGRVPLIYTPHSFASEQINRSSLSRRVYRVAERYAVRAADAVGAVSESEAEVALALGAGRVAVIPNGIAELDDPIQPTRPPLPGGRPRVIAGGRIVDQRRPAACARILKGVSEPADVAWVGGGGEEEGGPNRRALQEAGIEETGWLTRERGLAEMSRASVYLHFTAADGMPLSILEAMACDAIVVASDIPANRELLDERQLCRTEEEAIALIERILTDDDLRAELRASQAVRRERHSGRAMAQAWIRLYRSITFPELEPLPAPGDVAALA